MVDLLQGILSGFAGGIGAGLANYFIIKRLEQAEKRIQEKLNLLNGKNKNNKEK